MSSVDATKKAPYTPVSTGPTPAPATPAKAPSTAANKAVDLHAVVDAPKPDYSGLFPSLKGPGVTASVFGPNPPNPLKMSPAQLADGLAKMSAAIRANPGKVNDADIKLYAQLFALVAVQEAELLGSAKPPSEMSNRELFRHLVAFDLAKIAGHKRTPAQEKRYAELAAELENRTTRDYVAELDKEIKELTKLREQLKTKAALHCTGAATGVYGLVSHNDVPSMLASAAVIWNAAETGQVGEAALESAFVIGGRVPHPVVKKVADGIATGLNALQCIGDIAEYKAAGKKIEKLSQDKAAAIAEQEKKKQLDAPNGSPKPAGP